MSIELMKAVLEAMENLHRTGDTQVFDMYAAPELIPALRQAIEQAEKQEPVLWQWKDSEMVTPFDKTNVEGWTPLYTTPQQEFGDTSAAYMVGVQDGIKAEREACAKVCDVIDDGRQDLSYECATAIRARSNT